MKKQHLWILLSLALLLPAQAQAWWNKDWSFRKQLTLDTSAAGADIKGNLEDVPVLVRLHSGNFGYFLDLKQDGSDLRFIAGDDKTPLKYHIEKFDALNQMALIWVKVPKLMGTSNSNKIWMYYGNSAAPKADDAAGTYDVKQTLVYHFAGAAGAPHDETAYGNQASRSTARPVPTGLIGGGSQFSGGEGIDIPDAPSLAIKPDAGWTFSAWIKIDAPQKDAYVLQRHDGGGGLIVGINDTSAYAAYTAGGHTTKTPAAPLATGAWHLLAVAIAQGRLTVFVDGREAGSAAPAMADMAGDTTLGQSVAGGHGLNGLLDEVEMAGTARSADWLQAAYRGQGVDAKLVSYGNDEQADSGGGGSSTLPVILHNVTLDGWVVIIILAVMAAISWVVMLGKGLVIRRVGKDNRAFLSQFRQLTLNDTGRLDQKESEEQRELDDMPLLNALTGKHDHFQSSPIYRLYHQGIQEVKQRMGAAVGARASGLTSKAMNSIRATLDAMLVRETQKVNAHMVLLTIAISGGPFLGLLGTVVGVMITFANIAATGDVNINAIAPGIAAALVATVAGLIVAIPSLFGYNYLTSRIKAINSDMHVFVDEFVTKAEELYGT